ARRALRDRARRPHPAARAPDERPPRPPRTGPEQMTATSSSAAAAPAAADNSKIDRALLTLASVVVLGTIMSILDTTVVNVAINTLAKEFHTNLTTIQWVSTGYTLALATVIPLTGWIADRFGTKRLYMTSIGLFLMG